MPKAPLCSCFVTPADGVRLIRVKKTDKKIDNNIRYILTEFCESEKDKHEGFEWITHFSNYSNFPGSLSIVCVYRFNCDLAKVDRIRVLESLKLKLNSIDVKVKDIEKHVSFDTQENCNNENGGNWNERFK